MIVRAPGLTTTHTAEPYTPGWIRAICGLLRRDFEVADNERLTCECCLRIVGARVASRPMRIVGADVWGAEPESPRYGQRGVVAHVDGDVAWVQWEDAVEQHGWEALSGVEP